MFDEAAGEITIGGIYLRLFIQQPAWVGSLKRNKKPAFLSALVSLWSRKSDTKVFSESNTISQSEVETKPYVTGAKRGKTCNWWKWRENVWLVTSEGLNQFGKRWGKSHESLRRWNEQIISRYFDVNMGKNAWLKSWSLQMLHPSVPLRTILVKVNELWALKSLYSLAFFILSLLGSSEAKGVSYSLATEIRWTAYKILLWCKFGFIFGTELCFILPFSFSAYLLLFSNLFDQAVVSCFTCFRARLSRLLPRPHSVFLRHNRS